MRTFQTILLIILIGFLLWKGIYPAFTKIDSDFPNYYTASRLFIEKKDISHVYDDQRFQHQIHAYGIDQLGKFSPFPPVTALLMIPVASVSPIDALRIWTSFNIFILAIVIVLLSKITGRDLLWSGLLTLSSGIALVNNFRLGQFYLILLLLMMAGYYFWQKNPKQLSGLFLGIGGAIKYFPLIYLPLFVFRREWKIALWCCFTIVAMYGATMLLLGVEIHKHFLSLVLMDHLAGNIQDPYSSAFQSWNSLLKRFFVFDNTLNPDPLVSSWAFFYILKYGAIALVIGSTAIACHKLQKYSHTQAGAIQFGLTGIAGLVLLPAGATYHFLLLILPVGLFLAEKKNAWSFDRKILLALYISIGFIPYSFFRQFDGRGILTLLAYPRLLIITAIFLIALRLSWNYAANNQQNMKPNF